MTRDEAQELVMDYGLHLKDLPDEFKKDELIVLQAIQLLFFHYHRQLQPNMTLLCFQKITEQI